MKIYGLTAVAVAAAFSMTGCSAPMSAKESCEKYQELATSFSVPGASESMDRAKVTDQFTDLASKAPDSLKSDMTVVAEYLTVAIRDRDQAQADRMNSEYREAERRVRDTCAQS